MARRHGTAVANPAGGEGWRDRRERNHRRRRDCASGTCPRAEGKRPHAVPANPLPTELKHCYSLGKEKPRCIAALPRDPDGRCPGEGHLLRCLSVSPLGDLAAPEDPMILGAHLRVVFESEYCHCAFSFACKQSRSLNPGFKLAQTYECLTQVKD